LLVTPHHVRLDLAEEVDFSEEIARMFGYGNLEMTMHRDNVEAGVSDSWFLRDVVRRTLCGAGFTEIQTYSFVSPGIADKINLPQDSEKRNYIRLINPLGEENSVMRTVLLPNMLDILAGNYKKNNARVQAFEIGNTFKNMGEGKLAGESFSLSIGMYGEGTDFFALKGAIELLFAKLGLKNVAFESVSNTGTYHPGRAAEVSFEGKDGTRVAVGYFGEIHPSVLENCEIETKVCGGELDLDTVIVNAELMRHYAPLDKYPASTRDMSLLVKEDVTVGAIEAATREASGKLLESIRLFDVYRGAQVPAGMKSLAFNLVYRAQDRTLTDEEVSKDFTKIVICLQQSYGASLREI
jgi:phenylalanyl-tRNA synthetase beta chain